MALAPKPTATGGAWLGQSPLDPQAGIVYADYLEALMGDELKVMDSLTQRGIAVITTSAVLVTLATTIGSLVLGKDFRLADVYEVTKASAIFAVFLFALAAGLGLLANRPKPKDPPDLSGIKALVLSGDEEKAVGWVIMQWRTLLEDWFPKNTKRANRVFWALAAETGAVALLAGTVSAAILGL